MPKENQKGLLECIIPYFELEPPSIVDGYEMTEKAHGQVETRTYEVVTDTVWFREHYSD